MNQAKKTSRMFQENWRDIYIVEKDIERLRKAGFNRKQAIKYIRERANENKRT